MHYWNSYVYICIQLDYHSWSWSSLPSSSSNTHSWFQHTPRILLLHHRWMGHCVPFLVQETSCTQSKMSPTKVDCRSSPPSLFCDWNGLKYIKIIHICISTSIKMYVSLILLIVWLFNYVPWPSIKSVSSKIRYLNGKWHCVEFIAI